jgi:hypothetical protein
LNVHVYADGTLIGALGASNIRPDIANAYPGYGENHGFDGTASYAAGGTHTICVYAINDQAGGANIQMGCRALTINNDPTGSFDAISRGPGGIRIAWLGA